MLVTVETGPCALAVTVWVVTLEPEVVVEVTVEMTVVLPVAICEQAYEILEAGQRGDDGGRRDTLVEAERGGGRGGRGDRLGDLAG